MSAEYASLEVEKVVLHPIGTPASDDAVSKSYVDYHVSSEIALLVDSAPGVLNTLKEIASALGNDANLAVTLANSISAETTARTLADIAQQFTLDGLSSSSASLRTDLTSEIALRAGQKTSIDASIADEVSTRTSAVSDVNFMLQEESGSRVSADNALGSRIDDEKTRAEDVEGTHDSRLTSVENDKLNKAGGSMTGDLTIQDSYIYFGASWRVKASADGTRIEFQYKKTDTWKLALPFIAPQ
jgi:hypothetical protein